MSAKGFVDPYQNPYDNMQVTDVFTGHDDAYGKTEIWNPNSFFGGRISDWLGASNYQTKYELAMARLNAENERASVASARAWDEYMQSTHYQRLVKDLEAAGLNPWLALQSGLGSTNNTQTASQGGSAKWQANNKSSSGKSGLAMLLFAAAKLLTAL